MTCLLLSLPRGTRGEGGRREATVGWGWSVTSKTTLAKGSKTPTPARFRSPTLPARGREKKAQAPIRDSAVTKGDHQ